VPQTRRGAIGPATPGNKRHRAIQAQTAAVTGLAANKSAVMNSNIGIVRLCNINAAAPVFVDDVAEERVCDDQAGVDLRVVNL
jgi:hypothetical protein